MSSWQSRELLLGVLGSVLSALVYWTWPSAAEREVRAITERVATAVARGDRAALLSEPCIQNDAQTADFLLRYSPELASGYSVEATRNGKGGLKVMSTGIVSHLGHIKTTSGTLCLAFWYERESGRLEFVTATYGGLPRSTR
jgi:hypothetical protein